jgi:S-DNA-T family DNA segregation ATPase FtsK/SpoIIIE
VTDEEVEQIVSYLKDQGAPTYIDQITEDPDEDMGAGLDEDEGGGSGDALYDQALAVVLKDRKASTSYIQRRLQIGYNRAARLVERMEAEGLVSQPNHVGKREVLMGNQ